MTPDEYLEMIIPSAKEICGAYELPYQVCVAQGAIESQWGAYGLGNGNFNIFGRKWNGNGDYVTVDTQEDDGTGNLYIISAKFQSYANAKDAVNDWCQLMIWGPYKPYSDAWFQDHDLTAFVTGIAGVYATDILYSEKIMSTIHACDLC
jgi:flagellum-specific peptidoglycan hydrolase FlgJ